MVRRYYDLPSLTALAAFEAVARHLNVKRAAAELNVTPGAVSRQLKALEDELGRALFVREGSGLHLTPQGEDLYAVLAQGFSQASEAVGRIKTGSEHTNVTLACTNAVASFWLMPRMGDFWRKNPSISVNHLISDNGTEYRRADVDLRIRYGRGIWPDEISILLFPDRIFPVAGPDYSNEHSRTISDEIAEQPVLDVFGVDPEWTSWDEFLRIVGIEHGPLRCRRFNNFSVLMQAAQDGQGLALGWERLIGPLVEQGKLRRVSDLMIKAPGNYHLTQNDNRALSPAAETLKSWLVETAHNEPIGQRSA